MEGTNLDYGEPDYDDDDAFQEDAQREFARLEKELGRSLTKREVEAVAEGLELQAEHYGEIDAQVVFDDHHEQAGTKPPDLDNKYERQKWMTERLTDAEAANAPDDSERKYDLDNKQDRLAWMTERMNGTEFDDVPAAGS